MTATSRPTLLPGLRQDREVLSLLERTLRSRGYLSGTKADGWERVWHGLRTAVEEFQSQHIDPRTSRPLVVDGVVGPATWRALDDSTDQRLDIGAASDGMIPAMTDPRRMLLLKNALDHYDLRVRERPMGSNRVEVLGRETQGKPWCSYWVHDRIKRTTGLYMWGGRRGSTRRDKSLAERDGILYSGQDILLPGDVGLVTNDVGTPRHTYFVVRVSEDGTRVNTVEGNVSNRVGVRERPRPTMWWDPFSQSPETREAVHFDRGIVPNLKQAAGESTR